MVSNVADEGSAKRVFSAKFFLARVAALELEQVVVEEINVRSLAESIARRGRGLGNRECYEAQKEKRDRRAQQNSPQPWWWLGQRDPIVRLTKWLVIWTALLFAGTGVSGAILWKTDITLRETLEVNQRPWLAISATPIADAEISDSGLFLPIEYSLKNSGRTPAVGATIEDDLYVGGGAFDVPDAQRKACSRNQVKLKDDDLGVGYSVFPDDIVKSQNTLSATQDQISGAVATNDAFQHAVKIPRDKTSLNIWIVGCVNYYFTFGDEQKVHQTGFALQVTRNNQVGYVRSTDKKVPLSQVMIDRNSFTGGKAD